MLASNFRVTARLGPTKYRSSRYSIPPADYIATRARVDLAGGRQHSHFSTRVVVAKNGRTWNKMMLAWS